MSVIESNHLTPPESPNRPHVGRTGWFLLGCVTATLAILFGLVVESRLKARRELEQETRESLVPMVNVMHPKPTAAEVEVELPGNIQAYEESPIYARANGYVKRWLTDIGTRVQEGQLLAEIETPELDQELNQSQAALAQSRANLEIARISAERWQNLRRTDAVSQQETDEKVAIWHAREADVKAAEASLQRLRELTSFKQVVAPFSGVVTVRNVDVGHLITAAAGRELFRLAKVDPLRVYVSLPQAYSQTIKAGDEATLQLEEMPGAKFTGRVVRTSGAIDPLSRTLLTEVQVPNPVGKLFAGAHAMVRLTLASPNTPLLVPSNALLFRGEAGMQVGVVGPDGTVRLANVVLGRDFGTSVEIVRGVTAGDNVILNPSDSLQAGSKVRVAPQTEETK